MILQWPKSKAVHTIELKEVLNTLDDIRINRHVGSLIEKRPHISSFKKSTNLFLDWVSDIVDLSEFEYAYAVNGVTDAIHHWLLSENRTIQSLSGDYQWPNIVNPNIVIKKSPAEIDTNKVLYISNPSAIDGCYRNDWEEILNCKAPMILDCAYVGTVFKKRIRVTSNVEAVFFSFSKSFGLGRLRLGWYFSRKPIPSLDPLHQMAYFPALIVPITELLTLKFPVDYFHQHLSVAQSQICNELNLTSSDSYLLAKTQSSEYKDWVREGSQYARIPLAGFYNQLKEQQRILF